MTEQVDLSPAGLAKAKKIAEKAWDWPPSNRDDACDLAHTLLPVLIDHVQSFTWEMAEALQFFVNVGKRMGADTPTTERALDAIDRIVALLPPRG